MNNKPILITGCQRSGTTLLNLVLDSHPDIHGIDETAYDNDKLSEYLSDARYHPCVSFKLPTVSPDVVSFKRLPDSKVLWCVRNPRDVVASMIKLHMQINRFVSVSWGIHPLGAEREIQNCLMALDSYNTSGLNDYKRRFEEIKSMQPVMRSRDSDGVTFMCALCWRVKNELLEVYRKAGIELRIVRYESLVAQPGGEIGQILEYLEVPWHANVLKHHTLHSGISIGNTDKTRPIDGSNTGRWKKMLSPDDLVIIDKLCADIAHGLGYTMAD